MKGEVGQFWSIILKIDRLNGDSGGFESDFVERGVPELAMKLDIRLHLGAVTFGLHIDS
jgi:hypothetical protein